MADPGAPTNVRRRTPTFDSDGRRYGVAGSDRVDTRVQDLADAIAPFVVSIWGTLVELPMDAADPPGRGGDELPVRVTVTVPGDRWLRLACEAELGRMIGAHVFGQSVREVDVASSRMAVLELASTIAKHVAVIEHPAWPWTARGPDTSTADRKTACELWFASRGHRLAVALLYRPGP